MKTILVATDFSSAASNAANYAADMALAIDAGVTLLHVFEIPAIYSEFPVAATYDEIDQDAEDEIKRLQSELLIRTGGKIHIETDVRIGNFFHVLKTVCEQITPYTVVIGSQDKTTAERLVFGTHAVFATKNLLWPLITVPVACKFSCIKKIGVAFDFNKIIDVELAHEITALVKQFHAELHVINIIDRQAFSPQNAFESNLLHHMLEELNPYYYSVPDDNTDEAIIEYTERNNIDLLIVMPGRHSFFEGLVHKSHTKQFVLHAHVPVMAMHC